MQERSDNRFEFVRCAHPTRNGEAHGRRANFPLVAAVTPGDSTALVVSLLGLGALLAASAFWFTVVKWAGGLYLLCLGVKLLRAGLSASELAAPAAPGS